MICLPILFNYLSKQQTINHWSFLLECSFETLASMFRRLRILKIMIISLVASTQQQQQQQQQQLYIISYHKPKDC
jgi:hypothetical protein